MNILHMKYAVEIAKVGSINKASEVLLIAQPNLSRSIKELESDLGITIFSRTSKGMYLTPEGEEFINYAKNILHQMDELEAMYKSGIPIKQKFSISVPRASYISDAFARFSLNIGKSSAEIFYNETNSLNAIKNILEHDYQLGIIRYASIYDKYFKSFLNEKGLVCELVSEFRYVVVISRNSPLAQKESLQFSDLRDYIEIAHADPYVPSLPLSKIIKEELTNNVNRRIFVFERGSQFELLTNNAETYMWVSPLPETVLGKYSLVQKICTDNKRVYKDMLIHRKDYLLSSLDKHFITELCNSKRRSQ